MSGGMTPPLWAIFGSLLVAGSMITQASACCGEDCPKEERCPERCEDHSGRCVDKSEHCAEFEKYCENFFFRRCVRCACPKTCGICKRHHSSSSSSSSEETTTTSTTTTTTTSTTTPLTTTTPSTTTSTATTTTESPTTTKTTTTPESTTTSIEVELDLVKSPEEDVSAVAAEFKDQKKVYCKPCEVRRKELKELFDTYYPVTATTSLPSLGGATPISNATATLEPSTLVPDLHYSISSTGYSAGSSTTHLPASVTDLMQVSAEAAASASVSISKSKSASMASSKSNSTSAAIPQSQSKSSSVPISQSKSSVVESSE